MPGVSNSAPRWPPKNPPGKRLGNVALAGTPSQLISERRSPASALKALTVASSAAGDAPETVRISGAAEAAAGKASATAAEIREAFRSVAISVVTPWPREAFPKQEEERVVRGAVAPRRRRAGRADREGAVSSREVVDAHLERIEAVNGHLNAVVLVLADEARAAADAADAATDRSGPLHGVPFTVKENIDVAGHADDVRRRRRWPRRSRRSTRRRSSACAPPARSRSRARTSRTSACASTPTPRCAA